MTQYLAAYGATAIGFLLVDVAWLSSIGKRFCFSRLGPLLLDRPNMPVAAAFYAVYVIGIVIFAVAPALREGSASTALVNGGLFGFFAYATYDMTNYATLRNWCLTVSVVDTLWGTSLTGVSAILGYLGARFLMLG